MTQWKINLSRNTKERSLLLIHFFLHVYKKVGRGENGERKGKGIKVFCFKDTVEN